MAPIKPSVEEEALGKGKKPKDPKDSDRHRVTYYY